MDQNVYAPEGFSLYMRLGAGLTFLVIQNEVGMDGPFSSSGSGGATASVGCVAKEVDAQESDSQLLYSTLSCALAAHAFRARVRSRYISPYGRGKC
jgi:hypothetical protein